MPTKLDIPIIVPDKSFRLDAYLSSGIQPGEELLPEDTTEDTPTFTANKAAMAQLEEMGFPRPRCEKALYNTGNADAESAMTWLFGHMEDPNIDDPLVIPASGGAKKAGPSQTSIGTVMGMGFTAVQAKKALGKTHGNVEAAVEWIFSHLDDSSEDESMGEAAAATKSQEEPGSKELPADFKLSSIVCHKGGSIHAGHYVAFIKKDLSGVQGEEGESWVLFNDEKVVKSGDAEEMMKFASVSLPLPILERLLMITGMSTSSRGFRAFLVSRRGFRS